MATFAATRVAILEPTTGQPVAVCSGPGRHGRCTASSGGAFACADHQLLAAVAGDSLRFRVFVPGHLERCPLADHLPELPLRH